MYPTEHLRNKLVSIGIPRSKHDVESLGKILPYKIEYNGLVRFLTIYKFPEHFAFERWTIDYSSIYHYEELKKRGCPRCSFASTQSNAMAKMLIYLKENDLLENNKYCTCTEFTTHSMGAIPPDYKKLLTICNKCGFSIKE